MTSFQLSQFSLPESMDSEVTNSKKKLKTTDKKLKTIKIRLFPEKDDEKEIKTMLNQFRWYYNATIYIAYKNIKDDILKENKLFNSKVRDNVLKYSYKENTDQNPAPP